MNASQLPEAKKEAPMDAARFRISRQGGRKDYGPNFWSDESADEFAAAAVAEAYEDAAGATEALTGALAISRDRAREAGRHGVADCRQSDIETCERIAHTIRARAKARLEEGDVS